MHRFALACLIAFGALVLRTEFSYAQNTQNPQKTQNALNLEGSWSGGGAVSMASGAREHARCRARYSRRSNEGYIVNAVCATPSIRAVQTASLHKIGDNKFRGTFYNREYGISGTIYVVVRGNTQSVRLTSESGWASLQLSR
jgi:hypothetical protein